MGGLKFMKSFPLLVTLLLVFSSPPSAVAHATVNATAAAAAAAINGGAVEVQNDAGGSRQTEAVQALMYYGASPSSNMVWQQITGADDEWAMASETARRQLASSDGHITYRALDPNKPAAGSGNSGHAYTRNCETQYNCRS